MQFLNSHIIYVEAGLRHSSDSTSVPFLKMYTYDLSDNGKRTTKQLSFDLQFDVDKLLTESGLLVTGHNMRCPAYSVFVCEWDLAKLRTVFGLKD